MGEGWSRRTRRLARQQNKDAVNMHPHPGFNWKKIAVVMVIAVIAILVLPHLW